MSNRPLRAIKWRAVSTIGQASQDKVSLDEQDRLITAAGEREGWVFIDDLVIPGHSRDYFSFEQFAADCRAIGIDAPDRMLAHWEAQDFDVFACFDGSRFGREISIFAQVVRQTVRGGALVYTVRDGYIDAQRSLMFVTMGGYATTEEREKLRARWRMGTQARAQRGKSKTGMIPFSHYQDDTGRLLVRRNLQPLFDAIYRLFVDQRVGYEQLGVELLRQYGIVHPHTQRPFSRNLIPNWLFQAPVWGNGTGVTPENVNPRSRYRYFVALDPYFQYKNETPPFPVFYDVCESVWRGDQRNHILSEIDRRSNTGKGGRRGVRFRKAFSGLIRCEECGALYSYNGRHKNALTGYYGCCNRGKGCTNSARIREDYMVEFLTRILEDATANQPSEWWTTTVQDDGTAAELVGCQQQLKDVNRQIENVIAAQSRLPEHAPVAIVEKYDTQIQQLSDQYAILIERERALLTRSRRARRGLRLTALEEVRTIGVPSFWSLPAATINKYLLQLFENSYFVARGNRIVRLEEKISTE